MEQLIREEQNLALAPVEYNEEVQWGLAERLVKEVFKVANQAGKKGDLPMSRLIAAAEDTIFETALKYIVRFKHPSFDEENEWRLFAMQRRDAQTDYRPSAFGLTPYIQIPIKFRFGEKQQKLLLTRVYVGPSVYSSLAAEAIRKYLNQQGFEYCDVQESSLPFRPGR